MEELLKIYNGISKGINDFCIDNVDNVETIRIFTDDRIFTTETSTQS